MLSAAARIARTGALLLSLLAVLALGVLALAGCGGGGGGGGGGGDGISNVTPGTFPAARETAITIHGSGFGPVGPATVRLTSTAGTPFSGGAASFVDVAGTVVDDDTITFTSPIGTLCPTTNVGLSVRVTLPSLEVFDTVVVAVTMAGPTIASFSPATVPGTLSTAFTITGNNFGPVPGSATVNFTASLGTPFLGGTSSTVDVVGTVVSGSSITGMTPIATGATDFTATVRVELDGGSCVTSTPAIVAFVMTGPPVLSSSLTGPDLTVAQGDRVTFTVTATDPEGDPITMRLVDPPNGVTLDPVVAQPSPHTATLEWVVDAGDDPGPWPLIFEATGGASPVVSRFVVWTHLTPWTVRTLRVGDVTGDGTDDVVVVARNADVGGLSDVGAIYVWAGATTPSGTPTATLKVTAPIANDQLGRGGLRLADVTGDGTLDVIASTDFADVAAANDAGAIYVWFGGAGLTGSKNPDATLTSGGPTGSFTHLAAQPLLWQVGDVTGDGTDDIVACASTADEGAVDTGAVYLWKGGVALTGALTPDVQLLSAAPAAGDELGRDGVQLSDLTGDGTLDVFSGAPRVGIFDTGELYVWFGGAGLAATTGIKAADASMTGTTISAFDALGTGSGSAIRLVDVSGDGTRDVLAPVPTATIGGVSNVGAILYWKGGATLTGAKTEDATMVVTGALLGDRLGSGPSTRLLVADVSGDGTNDVVGVASEADAGLTPDVGAIYLWLGGATLVGAKAADATLKVVAPTAGDGLGRGGTRLADVTGDGLLDVVSASPFVDAGFLADVGAVYVWAGGAGLTGAVAPTATLAIPSPTGLDSLALDPAHGAYMPRFGDVSNDGVLDVCVPAPLADVAVVDAGAIFVWNGGGGLTGAPAPSATLTVTGAIAQDRLGASSGPGVALADVTGDGVFDVVSAAALADLGATDAGVLYAWRGGATLTGPKAPDATMRALAAFPGDQLGGGMPDGVAWDLFDLTADGTRDVIGVACLADTATLTDSGAAYLFAGGAGLTGTVTPTATFRAPNAANVDALGRSIVTDLLFAHDVSGDGTLDLLLGAADFTGIAGPSFRGGVFLWKGGALSGTPAATTSFLVPGAIAQDRLGN